MALHALNIVKPVVYVSISDGITTVFVLQGEATVFEIDWDYVYEEIDPDTLQELIDTVETTWPEGTTNPAYLRKDTALGTLRERLAYINGEEDEP